MALWGDFETMPLTDLLEWVATVRRTGLLRVELDECERYAFFRDGAVVAFGSNDFRRDSIAHVLTARGLVATNVLERAVARQLDTGRPLVDLLVADGALDDAGVAGLLDETARELLYDVFLWDRGRFTFTDAKSPPFALHAVAAPIEARDLAFSAVVVRDEWRLVKEILPDERTAVRRIGGSAPPHDATFLARHLHASLARQRTVDALALETGVSVYAVMRELYALARAKCVEVAPRLPGAGAGTGAIDGVLRGAEALLRERQWDESAALFKTVLNATPSNARARAGLGDARARQLEEARARVPASQVVRRTPLDEAAASVVPGGPEWYVLGRLEGVHAVAELVTACPFAEVDVLRALERLRGAGLVTIETR